MPAAMLGRRKSFKMPRIDAVAILADMVKLLPFRDVADEQHVCGTVSANITAVVPEVAVAVSTPACPFPACRPRDDNS